MKSFDIDASRLAVEQMIYTQLGKNELCDVKSLKEGNNRGKEIAKIISYI